MTTNQGDHPAKAAAPEPTPLTTGVTDPTTPPSARRPRLASRRRPITPRDREQLVRRLNRIEGQVRGVARMIEREEACVDILQQTAALRAAIDSVALLLLEDHVEGSVRRAAERGRADGIVQEVLEPVRRTLGRPIRGSRSGL